MLVRDVIRRVLQGGRGKPRRVNRCPPWPPDLFAVVATLAGYTDFYARFPFSSPWHADHFVCSHNYRDEVTSLGAQWARLGQPPKPVLQLWRQLISAGHLQIGSGGPEGLGWKISAMKLLAIADEASCGIGFSPDGSSLIAQLVLNAHIELIKQGISRLLPFVPFSLCIEVEPGIACVQPKTNTPLVGCRLRSLTHHLALLPPLSQSTDFLDVRSSCGREF